MPRAGILARCAACTSLAACPDFGPRIDPDGGSDAAVDAPACAEPLIGFEVSNLDRCALPAPTGSLDLGAPNNGDWVYDTFADNLTGPGQIELQTLTFDQDDGPTLRVIVVDEVNIPDGSTLRVQGQFPWSSWPPATSSSRTCCPWAGRPTASWDPAAA